HSGKKEQALRGVSYRMRLRPNDNVKPSTVRRIPVHAAAGDRRPGWLTGGQLGLPVAPGGGGIKANKREGDGGTPRGPFPFRRGWGGRGGRALRMGGGGGGGGRGPAPAAGSAIPPHHPPRRMVRSPERPPLQSCHPH